MEDTFALASFSIMKEESGGMGRGFSLVVEGATIEAYYTIIFVSVTKDVANQID
jgi:hypothetical protein